MTTTIRAVFDGAVFRPEHPQDLRPDATYILTVEHEAPDEAESPPTGDHPLIQISRLATDMGVDDLSINHDWYAHGRGGDVWRTDEPGATATATIPPEQRVTLSHVSWETYERLLADHVDCQTPRLTFDHGTLEIVGTLSQLREEPNAILWSFVEHIATEWSIDPYCVGSMTFVHKGIQQGFSPDTAFYIQHAPHVRRVGQIDPTIHPPPDLVIEIDISRQSLNKLPVYAGFGVPEVWRVREGLVLVYSLRQDGSGEYDEVGPSRVLPPVNGETLTRFLAAGLTLGRAEWVRSIRAWAEGVAG